MRPFALTCCLSLMALTGIIAQGTTEPAGLLRAAFAERNAVAVWHLAYRGQAEDGEKLELFLAYDEVHYLAYIRDGAGELHYFEGEYSPDTIQWVEYREDIVRGYLQGRRGNGLLIADWLDARRAAGRRVQFEQTTPGAAAGQTPAGAIYLLTGSLSGTDAELLLDWQTDGRVCLRLMREPKGGITAMHHDDFFPGGEAWTFHHSDGAHNIRVGSPLQSSEVSVRNESDRSTIEYGNFSVDVKITRSSTPPGGTGPRIERLSTGSAGLDRRIQGQVEDWLAQVPGGADGSEVWFEATDAHDLIVFGRWWIERPGEDELLFKSVAIDARSGKVWDIAGHFSRRKNRGQTAGEATHLVLIERELCREGPKHRVYGSTRQCVTLEGNGALVQKRFRERIKTGGR
jgi:hypothetical protein